MAYIGKNLVGVLKEQKSVSTLTGNGSITTLTLSDTPGSVNNVLVFFDGLRQQPVTDYSVDGNTAHILLVSTDNVKEVLTVNSGTITSIVEAIVVNSSQALETSGITIEEPTTYVVGKAFPNPFNPSTNISLELNTSADVSVKVYNLMGQLVSVIAEGAYSPATYNWTWNADNLASGAYLVKTQVGSDVNTQKVMLLK